MAQAERQTAYRWGQVGPGAVLAFAGACLLFSAIHRMSGWGDFGGNAALGLVGWGSPLLILKGVGLLLQLAVTGTLGKVPAPSQLAWMGGAAWILGWVLVAGGIRRVNTEEQPKSEAAGAKLFPQLVGYRDFYWSTLGAYGGGILFAELALIFLQTALAGGVRMGGPGSQAAAEGFHLSPPVALAVSGTIACLIAFGAGFLGAARSRRLSVPEATLGLVYLGLPVPLLLTLMGYSAVLQQIFGYKLREVVYLASQLGDRAELGYWLGFAVLVLMMVLGITSGFVATGSGRLDTRTGFELFVSGRHVQVFRPRLLLGLAVILLLGVIPPLIIYAIIRAAEAAVERTRIRALGLQDPLRATQAMNEWKTREQSPTEMMTALSVAGVGVGVMALIVVLSVMSGFEVDLQKKILGANAHIILLKYSDEFSEYKQVMEKVKEVPGVIGETPFIVGEVMLSANGNVAGSVIKGIDPATVENVTEIAQNILPGGSLDNLTHPENITAPFEERREERPIDEDPNIVRAPAAKGGKPLPGILLGRELAASLKVVVGDRLDVVTPLGGELGPNGPIPKSRPFRVAGIFYSGMYEYDSKSVYILLKEAQDFFNLHGATGIELKVTDPDDARRIAKAVVDKLDGYPYRARDWGELNRNLFSALKLEKLVMGIILSIIVVVAAGLIVATVIMLVLEKRKEISVLKALGVPDGGIVKIFLAEGLQIGIAGGLLGLFSGMAWCLFIDKVGIHLDPEVYYIPSLPVKIEPFQTALSVLIAVLTTYLGSIYPALKASRVEPVEGLKAE